MSGAYMEIITRLLLKEEGGMTAGHDFRRRRAVLSMSVRQQHRRGRRIRLRLQANGGDGQRRDAPCVYM